MQQCSMHALALEAPTQKVAPLPAAFAMFVYPAVSRLSHHPRIGGASGTCTHPWLTCGAHGRQRWDQKDQARGGGVGQGVSQTQCQHAGALTSPRRVTTSCARARDTVSALRGVVEDSSKSAPRSHGGRCGAREGAARVRHGCEGGGAGGRCAGNSTTPCLLDWWHPPRMQELTEAEDDEPPQVQVRVGAE